MPLDDYKIARYKNLSGGWVAEISAIAGCHALMPTREEALTELAGVFEMISEEYAERQQILPVEPC